MHTEYLPFTETVRVKKTLFEPGDGMAKQHLLPQHTVRYNRNMTIEVKLRKFTVEEYARMGEAGVFTPDERVELIEGDIIPVSPQNHRHAKKIARLTTRLVKLFGESHEVRVQLPLTLGDKSEPEPDFALVRLEVSDSCPRHPNQADLVLELADSSLPFDRKTKASLYAKAGIPEYWVLNLKHQKVEVRTQPAENSEGPFDWDYSSLRVYSLGETVSPMFAPQAEFNVEELVVV